MQYRRTIAILVALLSVLVVSTGAPAAGPAAKRSPLAGTWSVSGTCTPHCIGANFKMWFADITVAHITADLNEGRCPLQTPGTVVLYRLPSGDVVGNSRSSSWYLHWVTYGQLLQGRGVSVQRKNDTVTFISRLTMTWRLLKPPAPPADTRAATRGAERSAAPARVRPGSSVPICP